MNLEQFLRDEVKPALGCTEPGAVALAAAHASRAHGGQIESIRLDLSLNVYKNGRSVMLPNTGGLKGNRVAAALGAQIANPDHGLTLLQNLSPEMIAKARQLVDAGKVEEQVQQACPPVWIRVTVHGEGHTASCTISGKHDNVVHLQKDDEILIDIREDAAVADSGTSPVQDELKAMRFGQLWELAKSINPATEAFLIEGSAMNMEIAQEGMRNLWGMGVGLSVASDEDILSRIRHATGGASDVRMSGGKLPVMSSAGSGNHGITAIIPVAVVADALKSGQRQLAEALALSHLVCGYLKAFTGRLTPICGCSVAAGAGASAAIAYLLGATPAQAERAVITLVAALLGMICDGAKETCSLKVAAAACEAYSAAVLAIKGGGVHDVQGMVVPNIHELGTILAEFSQRIYSGADSQMAQIMLQHQ